MSNFDIEEGTTVLQKREGKLENGQELVDLSDEEGSIKVFTEEDDLIYQYSFNENSSELRRSLDDLEGEGFHIVIGWDAEDGINWMVNGEKDSTSL